MATRRTSKPQPPKEPLELLVSRDEAKSRIQERIEKGLELKQRKVDTSETFDTLSNDYSKWDAFNSELLKRVFTSDELAKEYDFWGAMMMSMREPSLGEKIADIYKDVDKKIHRLDSIIERLELIPLSSVVQNSSAVQQEELPSQPRTKKVFVVHGRDEVAKTSLEVFLHEIGIEARSTSSPSRRGHDDY